jgi:hypothetical protein
MPDVPELDFEGALIEIWLGLSSAAYHLAYVRVYSQTDALQTNANILSKQDKALREATQVDVVICRAHLAAFFWQLDHVFESLRTAIARGKKEHSGLQYFWEYEKRLKKIEQKTLRKEINIYRNTGHEIPAIIGCAWDGNGQFVRHFLPSLLGNERKEELDLITQLKQYFEFVVNEWLDFVPNGLKNKFPRSFSFPITIPNSYLAKLSPELEGTPQLVVSMEPFHLGSEVAQTVDGDIKGRPTV